MAEPLTKKELDKGLEGLARIFKKEINSFRTEVNNRFTEVNNRFAEVNKRFDENDKKLDKLINSLDKYIKRVEEWQEESKILAARIERMKKVLIKKGIATEKELNLT